MLSVDCLSMLFGATYTLNLPVGVGTLNNLAPLTLSGAVRSVAFCAVSLYINLILVSV